MRKPTPQQVKVSREIEQIARKLTDDVMASTSIFRTIPQARAIVLETIAHKLLREARDMRDAQ